MAKNFTFRRNLAANVAPVCFTIEGIAFEYQPDNEKAANVQQLAAEIAELSRAVPVDVSVLITKHREMLEIILGNGAISLLSTALGRTLELVDFVDLVRYLTNVLEEAAKGK